MAGFGDIPAGLGMQPGFGVRRRSDDSGFEGFDTVPFIQSDLVRDLNDVFQPSATDNSLLTYSVDIAVASALLGTNGATVFLEISSDPDEGFVEMSRFTHSISGVISNSTVTGHLTCTVNAGWYVRLRTSVTGNATVTYRSGQETTLSVAY